MPHESRTGRSMTHHGITAGRTQRLHLREAAYWSRIPSALPHGSEEGAPRPLRAVVPGVIVGVVVMAGFGAWGMFKPTAPPKDWDEVGENVIIAQRVDDAVRGAEDRRQEAAAPRPQHGVRQAPAQERQGRTGDGRRGRSSTTARSRTAPPSASPTPPTGCRPARSGVRRSAGRSASVPARAAGPSRRRRSSSRSATWARPRAREPAERRRADVRRGPGQGSRYIVDAHGHRIPGRQAPTRTAAARPARLATARSRSGSPGSGWRPSTGHAIVFPKVDGQAGADAGRSGQAADRGEQGRHGPQGRRSDPAVRRRARQGRPRLGLHRPAASRQHGTGRPQPGRPGERQRGELRARARPSFAAHKNWPKHEPKRSTSGHHQAGSRNTVCNVLRERRHAGDGRTTLSTWAGNDFPAALPTGSTSAYVTPGSGQLYRQFQGTETRRGPRLPGHRHRPAVRDAVQRRQRQRRRGIGTTAKEREAAAERGQAGADRLGYDDVDPAPVPAEWSSVPAHGPTPVDGRRPRQPQGS